VHYGKFVSESKFTTSPSSFIPHILNKDRTALAELITKPAIERALLSRLGKKATIYGTDIGIDGEPVRVKKTPTERPRGLPSYKTPWMDKEAKALPKAESQILASQGIELDDEEFAWKIDVEEVKHLYEKWIIPLTKEVEVEYLIHRLDGMTPQQIEVLQEKHPNSEIAAGSNKEAVKSA